MTKQFIAAAAALALGIGSAAAADPQSGSNARRQGERVSVAPVLADEDVVLIGCVEFEQDYRKRMAAGRGGVLGTGVGATDEFVLTNVRPAPGQVGTSGSANGRRGTPGNASGTANANPGAGGGVYTLTGDQEKNLKRDVGRQVEIVGTLENAGKPSTGAELTDISDLPRVIIETWHPVGDFCPAK